MRSSLKALEARVQKVVKHLEVVTKERDRLREEVAPLRERLESFEVEPGSTVGVARVEWNRKLEDVEQVLAEAVRDLRGA